MRRMMLIAAFIGIAFTVSAQTWAGRKVVPCTNTVLVANAEAGSKAVAVASVNLVYLVPTTNTMYMYATLDNVRYLRATIGPFTNATAVVYLPDALWLRKSSGGIDSLLFSNAVPAVCRIIIDYVY